VFDTGAGSATVVLAPLREVYVTVIVMADPVQAADVGETLVPVPPDIETVRVAWGALLAIVQGTVKVVVEANEGGTTLRRKAAAIRRARK